MPFDGNGNWTSNFNAEADRNSNIKIEASRFDNILLADIAQSFENCLTKDMQVKPQQNFNANNFRLINVANPINGSDAVNLTTLNNVAVHKAGTETITGIKTFNNSINRQGSWTAGTPSSGNQTSYINFTDSTGTSYGSIGKFYGAGGTFVTEMTGKKTDGTGEIKIAIGYDASGNPRATAPTPDTATNTTSTQIATTGWANTTGNNIVHLDSSETITGEKTFTGTTRAEKASAGFYQTYIKNTAVTIGTAPSTNTGYQIIMNDSSGTQNGRIGNLTITYKTDGVCDTYLTAYKPVGTGQTNSTMGIRYPASGDPYGYAPASDVVGSILTTASITKSAKGGVKLGNGIIINWGRSTGSTKAVTFTIPFSSNTSFSVTATPEGDRAYGDFFGLINTISSTGFTIVRDNSDVVHWIAIGY